MIISKQNRKSIYMHLFREGVLVAPKDVIKKASQVSGCTNLEVVCMGKSLASRGYVKVQYAWGWLYYTLTDEGIAYLREFLSLPADIVPATLQASSRPMERLSASQDQRDSRGGPRDREDGYRRSGGAGRGAGGAGGMRGGPGGRPAGGAGGYGRGRAAPPS